LVLNLWGIPSIDRPSSQSPQYQLYFPYMLPAEHYLQSGEKNRDERLAERTMDIARPYPSLKKKLKNRAINDW